VLKWNYCKNTLGRLLYILHLKILYRDTH